MCLFRLAREGVIREESINSIDSDFHFYYEFSGRNGRPPGNHYLEPANYHPSEIGGGWVSESFHAIVEA